MRNLAGYSPQGCKESDMTEQLSTYTCKLAQSHSTSKCQCCDCEHMMMSGSSIPEPSCYPKLEEQEFTPQNLHLCCQLLGVGVRLAHSHPGPSPAGPELLCFSCSGSINKTLVSASLGKFFFFFLIHHIVFPYCYTHSLRHVCAVLFFCLTFHQNLRPCILPHVGGVEEPTEKCKW